MTLVQILIIALSLLFLFRAIAGFKKRKTSLKTSVSWMGLWIIAIIAAILPQTTIYLSKILGVGRGVDVAVYFSILLLFFLVYKIMVRLERIEHEISEIARHLALKKFKEK